MTAQQLRDTLTFIFNGAAVQRYHTTPPLRPQTDGAHSFGVAWLAYLLTGGAASRNLILAALAHDLAEYRTGDLPAMIKRVGTIGAQLEEAETAYRAAVGLNFPLTEEETSVLATADRLEGMMFCIAERGLGNQEAERWFRRFATYVSEAPAGAQAKELLEAIFELWEEACPTTIPLTYGR
jgi:5'-deoxynucleotidase YfbR-like HD superfamily hydrolase